MALQWPPAENSEVVCHWNQVRNFNSSYLQFDDICEAAPVEETSTGSISTVTYARYFRAGGHYLILFCVLLFFVIAEVGWCNVKV